MKKLNEYIFEEVVEENKYISEAEFNKIFFTKLIKEEPFKSTIGRCDKDIQELFIFKIYIEITQYGYYLPSVGNRIVQDDYIWSKLKKYTDGEELAEMIKTLNSYL